MHTDCYTINADVELVHEDSIFRVPNSRKNLNGGSSKSHLDKKHYATMGHAVSL